MDDNRSEVQWLYVTGRGAGLSRDDFPRQWKSHADLSGSVDGLMEEFTGTVLYTLLDEEDPDRFTAAATLTLPDDAAIASVLTHPEAIRIIHPDEVRVFGAPIATLSLAAHREVIVEGEQPREGAAAAYAWVTRSRDVSAGEFASELRSLTRSIAAGAERCVIDWRHDGPFAETIYHVDAVVELYGDAHALKEVVRLVHETWVDHAASWTVTGHVVMNWNLSAS